MCCHQNEPVPLIKLFCSCCEEWFYICRSCFRNHVYCSDSCSTLARQESKRRAHRKHLEKEGIREYRLEQERERRRRKKAEKQALLDNSCSSDSSADPSGSRGDHTSPGLEEADTMDVSGLDECTQEAGRSSDGEGVEAVQERGSESPAENEDGVDVASRSYSSSPGTPMAMRWLTSWGGWILTRS